MRHCYLLQFHKTNSGAWWRKKRKGWAKRSGLSLSHMLLLALSLTSLNTFGTRRVNEGAFHLAQT